MQLPNEVPVMTLPSATLFPQALLPLYIFEPRYRRMLADVLESHRLFAVAMKKPGASRETPLTVAGLGLVRVAVEHKDGTSHLILQGVARVKLGKTSGYKPYRRCGIRPMETLPCDSVATDALLVKVRELLEARLKLGLPFPFPFQTQTKPGAKEVFSAAEVLKYLDSINNPSAAADLVSCAVLKGPDERQAILEATDVETRLRRLVGFLMHEIEAKQKETSE